MFIDLQPFTHNFFNLNNVIYDLNTIIIKDCIMDEIKIDETILRYVDNKEEWDYDTVLLAKFQNNLEAGNLNNNGLRIEKLKLKKRNIENMQWIDVKTFIFNPKITEYRYKDRLVESLETYEYALQPMTNKVLGRETIEKVDCDFEGAWIIGKDTQYQLQYNMQLSDVETVKKTNLYEPLGNKYPIIVENGTINYKKTNIKALLVADFTANNMCDEQIDRKGEKRLRRNIENFFDSGQPFIFKDSSGNYMFAKNISPIKLIPNNDLAQQVYEISLDVCEIGDAYDPNLLKRYGFIDMEDYQS